MVSEPSPRTSASSAMSDHNPQSSPQSSPRALPSSDPAAQAFARIAELEARVAFLVQREQQSASGSSSHAAQPPRVADLPKIRSPSSFAGAMGTGVDDWLEEMQQQYRYLLLHMKSPPFRGTVPVVVYFLVSPVYLS